MRIKRSLLCTVLSLVLFSGCSLGSSATSTSIVVTTTRYVDTVPYATATNKYWNSDCPQELRANDYLPLVKCDKGDGVTRVQQLLGVEADGLFGNDTFNAILDFQLNNGIAQTGVVDEETWFALDPSQSGPGADTNADGLVTPDEFR